MPPTPDSEEAEQFGILQCIALGHLHVCPAFAGWASSCAGTEAVGRVKPKFDQFQTSSPRCFCSSKDRSSPCFFRVKDFQTMLQDYQTERREVLPGFRVLETYVGTDTTHTAKLARALQMILGINERKIEQVFKHGRGCIFGWQLNTEEPFSDFPPSEISPCLAAKCGVDEETLLPGAKLSQFRMQQMVGGGTQSQPSLGAEVPGVEMGQGAGLEMEPMEGVDSDSMEVEIGLGAGSEMGGSMCTADDGEASMDPSESSPSILSSPPSPSPYTFSDWKCLDCNKVHA